MPQLGESIAEATIVAFNFQTGEDVAVDQDILEVETQKATMGVTSPCSGKLVEWSAQLQQSYAVGDTLGYVECSEEEARRLGLDAPAVAESAPREALPHGYSPADEATSFVRNSSTHQTHGVAPTLRGLPVPAHAAGMSFLSPRLKARMAELGLHAADLAGIAGSGAAGRLTIEDFEKFLSQLDQQKLSQASTMRVAVADAMRRSWTRPLATVGVPVGIDAMLAHRKTCNPKPGPALYALRALAIALGENSALAGRLVGDKIVHPRSIDVGFAVEAEDGVLVPVLRHADRTPLSELLVRYNDLVDLARRRRLPPDATGGSIATVTNFGTFGLEWATPIPLPEQTLVLGMGAGKTVPRWNPQTSSFDPATEAQFTLSFDHRVLDGGGAGRLVTRIAELLNNPDTL
ncbi:MAG: 2-oxo acid dehydrogenase subunit E2 [Verrucomicrobia bacterium]|nr:2-oxo acid dehydrogenase subunit E2 [Verrucomicrobiota bacterium]